MAEDEQHRAETLLVARTSALPAAHCCILTDAARLRCQDPPTSPWPLKLPPPVLSGHGPEDCIDATPVRGRTASADRTVRPLLRGH